MKKTMVFVLTLIFAFSCFACHAQDLSSMTLEELTARRQELINELTQINSLRGSMIRQQVEEGIVPEEALGKIIDLFPDETLAIIIRDQCGKISIEQPVTQADLDRVEMLTCIYDDIHDFTGIRYLRNMWYFHTNEHYSGVFPEELRYCLSLRSLYLKYNPNITVIPDWIGELVNLETIDFYKDNILQLPDSICNLTKLKLLDVSWNEGLAALPANMGNLSNLQNLDISHTAITELPDSIWNLQLSSFYKTGTSIR